MYRRLSPAEQVADVYRDQGNLERIHHLTGRRAVTARSMEPGLSVAVLNLDRPDLIGPLLASVPAIAERFAQAGLGFELVVGDTGSTDPATLRALEDAPAGVTVIRDLKYQFSRSNNDICSGRVAHDTILFLNNDVLLRAADPLLEMRRCLEEHPGTGIVGSVLDFPDGTLQHGGVDLVREGPLKGLPLHVAARRNRIHERGRSWPAIAVTGAALMIRTALWQVLGGLDESYERECQDVDLCLHAARLGYGVRVLDCGPLVHEENGTRPTGEESWADRRLFLRRWRSFLEARYL